MLKVSAKEYIELGNRIEQARVIFSLTRNHGLTDPGRGLSDREQGDLRKILIQIFDLCIALDLPIAGDLISQHFDVDHGHLPETSGEYDVLVAAMMAELKTRLFFFVPTYAAKYYDRVVPSNTTRLSQQPLKSSFQRAMPLLAAYIQLAFFIRCGRPR